MSASEPGTGALRTEPASSGTDVWVMRRRSCGSNPGSRDTEAEVGRVLDGYLDGASTILARDARGKPYLEGVDRLWVSIAHSRSVALLAVSCDADVGVDIEQSQDRGLRSLLAQALGDDERAALELLPAADRAQAFLTYWVRKEAILKAAGVGLAVDPSLIEVSAPWDEPAIHVLPGALGPRSEWTLLDLDMPGYAAAVAVRQSSATVRLVAS